MRRKTDEILFRLNSLIFENHELKAKLDKIESMIEDVKYSSISDDTAIPSIMREWMFGEEKEGTK